MIYILENYFSENLAHVLQMCQIAPFLYFPRLDSRTHIANVQLYYHSLFYNKLNSMKQSFSNTSEFTKLHHLPNFLGGRCPEFPSPTKPIVAKLLFLFFIMFLGDYALMLAHSGVRSYGPIHLPIPSDKSCIYPWL